MTRKKIVLIIIALFLVMVAIMPSFSYAYDPIEHPGSYKPSGSAGNTSVITQKANNVLGAITTVGVIVSVVIILILGIKYMVGSVDEKAEYKKSMIPYLIGAALLFSASTVVSIIANLTDEAIPWN